MTAARDFTGAKLHNIAVAINRRQLLVLSAFGLVAGAPGLALAAGPEGELTYAVHVSLAPSWFDPAEATGMITPFMILYALHDAMVKPMPGENLAPSLAELWSVSEDGLSYDFVLREGAKFHNGDPVTAEDVKFTFDRYRGTSHELMRQRVAAVEIEDQRHVRFRLAEPWPDFLTFYATTTGAGWIVPKQHIEKVGEEAFKKAPVGAGPYKFVSFKPGLELVLDAFEGYWRKTPAVKRLTLRVIPDEATRLAALKNGEVDIVYSVRGELAQELERTPGLKLKPALIQATFCVYFADQWDPKSPWHDVRVRRAANLAIDRQGSNEALMLGHALVSGNPIVPAHYDFFWQPPPPVYDPKQAKALLKEAGFPNGFDGGACYCDSSYANIGETVVDNLLAIGIRTKLRPIERAGFIKGFAKRSSRISLLAGPGAFGNAATRIAAHVVKDGIFPTAPTLISTICISGRLSNWTARNARAMLHKIQQLIDERAMFAPIWQLAFINGIGPRVSELSFGSIAGFPYTAPYENLMQNSG